MNDADREHFESYRAQTLAKHTILEKYIYAYFTIMKGGGSDNLVYIDGFAGRGTYSSTDGEVVPGSPLRALQKIASVPALAARVSTVFIERDPELYRQLRLNLDSFCASHPMVREPSIRNGTFSDEMNAIFDTLESRGQNIAPAFVFVDPCGVDGVDFSVIERLLRSQKRCEVFLFFNIDGVRRILGLKEKMGPTLSHLLGSDARARELLKIVSALERPGEREEAIIQYYERLVRAETPGKYVISFRVEKEDRRGTSHYLIHVAQHPLGFKIMKDVMWSVGQTAEGKGGLALEQASLSPMQMMFRPGWDAIKAQVLEELKAGKKPVRFFYEELSQRPQNLLCERAYRSALLDLEAEKKILVLDKEGRAPAGQRPRRKGVLTLAQDYYVKLL